MVTSWAFEHGRMPSEAYQLYLKNPKDFILLGAYGSFLEEQQKAKQKGLGSKSKI